MLKNFLIKLWDVFPFLHGVITLQLNYTPKVKPSITSTKSEFHLAYLVLFCSFYSFCHIKNITPIPMLNLPNSHHQPSTIINHQPSTINHQPSTINNHQPSTIPP
jgi:predicted HAD superfamily hydrolase